MRPLERLMRRFIAAADAVANRAYGVRWNPLHQSGTIAVAMLLVLLGTGVYLLLFYRLGAPSASVARIAADPWFGSWMRSLHRYATDIFIIAAVVHLLRMFAQSRSWGPRSLAWLSGLLLLGTGFICAWTGFVMAWDSFGERLAREGSRLLDVLPVLSEPVSRIFAGDRPVPGAFFFVNLFLHIGVPLAMGALLWIHVSRLARARLLPPRRVTWLLAGSLTALAIVWPAPLGAPASAFVIHGTTPTDLFVAWWLPLSERVSPGVVWIAGIAFSIVLLLVPRLVRRPREGTLAPSVVDPRLCTGCNQCPQDCPWEAITMVPRKDDRPTLVAFVNEARCVSCGICAGSCAPMGVGPPGRTGRDQLDVLRNLLPTLGADAPGGRMPVVAVVCNECPGSHIDAFRQRGLHVHPVSCAGNLHSSVVEWFIRRGSPGVIVGSCPPRDCVNREGPKWLHERLFNDREAELQDRVDHRRVRTTVLAPGMLGDTLADVDEFLRSVALLDRPVAADGEVVPLCEPVPIEEAIT